MPTLDVRTIISLGHGSCIITLPKSWLRYYGLVPGDKLEVIANGELRVRPQSHGLNRRRTQCSLQGTSSGGSI